MAEAGGDWVIVSGASGSIGTAAVGRFLARGHPVLGLDCVSDSGRADAGPGQYVFRSVDLTSEASVMHALEDSIPRAQRICLLINAVGAIWNEPMLKLQGSAFEPHSMDTWAEVIAANLTAPFVLASRVAARMARRGGGAIVNFSSISGRGNVGQAAYSAAKAGVEGLTRAMAAELGPIGIRVNAIAPGFIDTPSTRAALSEEQLAALSTQTPLRRLGKLDELMDALEFLADNAFVSGAVLDINGGLRI